MKIAALFTDYDGTIAPVGVRREDSAVPGPLFSVLSEISSRIPVAIITSKDLKFVRPRTTFAWAWATVLGLEVRLRDGGGRQTNVSSDLLRVLDSVRYTLPPGTVVEEKRGTDGSLLGASLDWTSASEPTGPGLTEAERALRAAGFQVKAYDGEKFLDVYAAPADKVSAFNELVKLLHVRGSVMYLGDSETDNGVFEVCDLAVCVSHSQRTEHLHCGLTVDFQELPGILSKILSDGLEFRNARGKNASRKEKTRASFP